MLNSVEIRHFRCFEHAALEGCSRVNLIVGKNASGKTALLEAIFLTIGPSPELAGRFKKWRNYDLAMSGTQQEIEEAMWSDLFYKLEKDREILIDLGGTGKHKRSLEVVYGPYESFTPTSPDHLFAPSPITFTWTRSDGQKFPVRPQFTGSTFQFPGVEHPAVDATFFASAQPVSNAENVKRFGALSKKRLEDEFIEVIKQEFPFITGISIEPYAGQSMLYADIPWLPEKIPLNMVSSGVSKLTTLSLAIAAQPEGILIIDEIENGLHYLRFESIWRSLYKLSTKFDVQIFVSTHSKECLEAAAKVFDGNPEDLALIQIVQEDGTSTMRVASGVDATAAIEGGIEVRR